MATRTIWDGKGDAEGKVYFTKDNGTFVGRPYVRRRVSSALSRWRHLDSLNARKAAISATIDNDAWLAQRNGCTVGALIRDVETALFRGCY